MHYSAIDGLRAFLAWTVVAAHITWYTGAAERVHALGVINKLADNAVTIFIIISGFVITNLTLTRKELYLPYITRRALRLYPAYLVCLSFGICTTYLYFDAFANLPWGGLTPHVQETESQVASLSGHGFANHLLAHLLLLNGVVPDNILYEAQMMFLAPAWSLSLEWQFYLVAPLVIAAMRNSGGRVAAAVVAGVAFIAYAKGAFGQFDHPSFLPGSAIYFAVGIITRLAFDRLPQVARYPTTLVILLLCVTFNVEHLRPLVLWGAFVAWWLLKIPSGETGGSIHEYGKRLFENNVINRLGKWSFATYLVHVPIIQLIIFVDVKYCKLGVWPTFAWVAALTLPLTLLASYLLYRYVEMPAIDLGKSIWARRSNAPGGKALATSA